MKSENALYTVAGVVLMLLGIALTANANYSLFASAGNNLMAANTAAYTFAVVSVAFALTVILVTFFLPTFAEWKFWYKAMYWGASSLIIFFLLYVGLKSWVKLDSPKVSYHEQTQLTYLSTLFNGFAAGDLKINAPLSPEVMAQSSELDVATSTSFILSGLNLVQAGKDHQLIQQLFKIGSETIVTDDYPKFLDVNDLVGALYRDYDLVSKQYINRVEAAPEEAEKQWQTLMDTLDRRWANFSQSREQLIQSVDSKTEAFIPAFRFYLRMRGECGESESCLEQVEKNYLDRIVNGLSLRKEPRYWCDKSNRTVGQFFADFFSNFGYQPNYENRLYVIDLIYQSREHYYCPNTKAHIYSRILAIEAPQLAERSGISFDVTGKDAYLASDPVRHWILEQSRQKGITLPDTWVISQKDEFLSHAQDALVNQAETRYRQAINTILGAAIEPGLSFLSFSRSLPVIKRVTSKLDLSLNDVIRVGENQELIIQTTMAPYYISRSDELLTQVGVKPTALSSVTSPEDLKQIINLVSTGRLLIATSLAFVALMIAVLIVIIRSIFSLTVISQLLSGLGLLLVIWLLPLVSAPAVVNMPFYQFFVKDFLSWEKSIVYIWLVHFETAIYRVGQFFS